MELRIKKLHPEAVLPVFAHETDAGMDLFSVASVTLLPGEAGQIPTGLVIQIPAGHVGLIWDKSGLSHTKKLKTLGGVIDSGYRGEVLVGILNTGDEKYVFEPGQKVAQMLIQKVEHPTLVEVDEVDDTVRGVGGFGSTGK